MFSLFYSVVSLAVYTVGRSFTYGMPLIIGSGTAAAVYLHSTPDAKMSLAMIVGVLVLAVPCMNTIMQTMLHPQKYPPPFKNALIWHKRYTDFLVFVAGGFLLLGFLILFLFDTVQFLQKQIIILEDKALVPEGKYEHFYARANVLLFLFGSRAGAVAASLVLLWAWFYCFRQIIRIPAHVEGYLINGREAGELTESGKWRIAVVSIGLNVPLASVVAFVPWEQSPLWLKGVLCGCGAWVLLHANMAFAAELYKEFTIGYSMRKLRYQ